MSIGSLGGILPGAAGASAAGNSAETDRARQDVTSQARQTATNQQADSASGIAETDGQDLESNDRDADGRRPWEIGGKRRRFEEPPAAADPPASKDASGDCGNTLDLSG